MHICWLFFKEWQLNVSGREDQCLVLRINGLFHLLIDGVFLGVIIEFLPFDPNLFEVSKHPMLFSILFQGPSFLGSLHLYMKCLEVERTSIYALRKGLHLESYSRDRIGTGMDMDS